MMLLGSVMRRYNRRYQQQKRILMEECGLTRLYVTALLFHLHLWDRRHFWNQIWTSEGIRNATLSPPAVWSLLTAVFNPICLLTVSQGANNNVTSL
jgi:hypothetical protein